MRQQQAAWQEQHQRLSAALRPGEGGAVTYQDFLWAAENVRSRAFSGPYTGSSGALGPPWGGGGE